MRSRANSLHSIRDEIIDGLQKMSASVNVLKQGVVKIYEDLLPPNQATYASPIKKSTHSAQTQTREEDPYETVSFKEKLVVDCPSPTAPTPTNLTAENELSNVEKAFHATFFGIVHEKGNIDIANKDHEDVEDADEVTPTGEEPVQDKTPSPELEEAKNAVKKEPEEEGSSTEEIGSDTDTLDVSLDMEGQNDTEEEEKPSVDQYNELMYKAVGASWDEVDVQESGLPPPLALHANLRTLKTDLLSSIFQGLYPSQQDCQLIRQFLSCPASLEEKYGMIRLSDILRKNKRAGIELEDIAEAMSQLAKIGTELLRPEDDRDPLWRTIPVAKEIMVTKGIASRAPWEIVQGGSEILESLGYTEYTGFALQYPRSAAPEFFADHIGNLTVELVLASVEISTLLIRVPPTLETLAVLQEAEAFPGHEPEVYYPEVPMLTAVEETGANDDKVESAVEHQESRAASMPAHIQVIYILARGNTNATFD